MSLIEQNLELILKRFSGAEERVKLIAVSKGQPLEAMLEYLRCARERGMPVLFGESYLQELVAKADLLPSDVEIHFIGGLQSNKVRDLVRLCHTIASVDSIKLLQLIDKEAKKIGKCQEVFLQVNVSYDPKKRGFKPEELAIADYENLRITGLMTITESYDQPEGARADFKRLSSLAPSGYSVSMGMSSDFEIAIQEGATHVRIGTLLFGERR